MLDSVATMVGECFVAIFVAEASPAAMFFCVGFDRSVDGVLLRFFWPRHPQLRCFFVSVLIDLWTALQRWLENVLLRFLWPRHPQLRCGPRIPEDLLRMDSTSSIHRFTRAEQGSANCDVTVRRPLQTVTSQSADPSGL